VLSSSKSSQVLYLYAHVSKLTPLSMSPGKLDIAQLHGIQRILILVSVGGFCGEIVLASDAGEVLWGMRVSASENCITNGLEISRACSGNLMVIAANNDNRVRLVDVETKRSLHEIPLSWAANGAAMCPTRR
jgi:hypothetical protein